MQGAQHRQPPLAPGRKPVPRGASRMVAKEPMSARLPKANFGFLKALFWPVLLVALIFGYLLFNEPLTTAIIIGGTITIIGLYLVNRAIKKK